MGAESAERASTPTGAVFLSYASQDSEAAQRICEALRAARVEVWFDQSELRGGDAWDRQIRKQIHDCALFELYRRQIAKGLDGDEREVLKARVFLREWFTGKIRMMPLAGRPRSASARSPCG